MEMRSLLTGRQVTCKLQYNKGGFCGRQPSVARNRSAISEGWQIRKLGNAGIDSKVVWLKRVLCGGRRVAIPRERPWRLSRGLPLRTVSTRPSLRLKAAGATLPKNSAGRRIRPQLECRSWWRLPELGPNAPDSILALAL